MAEKIVEVDGLAVELAGEPVLRDVRLTVAPGEVVALVGANGVGKSTLLRCLAGLQPPTQGRVQVLGAPPSDTAAFWRDVALMAEEPAWYPGLSAGEHLELMRAVHDEPRMSVEAALEMFGLAERADVPPANLSTGQRQRLALAAALLRPSVLLLLDEPERGLDAEFRRRLGVLTLEYTSAGGTVVMATHDPLLATTGRRLELAEGRAVG